MFARMLSSRCEIVGFSARPAAAYKSEPSSRQAEAANPIDRPPQRGGE
jgi:hypothetical protein